MRFKQILLTTLLIISSSIAFANDYYIATTVLNVRVGEGLEYDVSFTLQKGDEVEVLSTTTNWCRVKYLGKTGYANFKYLKYNRTVSDIPSETPKQVMSYLLVLVGVCIGILLYILFLFFRKERNKKLLRTVTELNRGTSTERNLVLKLLKFGLPADIIFHDLYVEKQKGDFSQIDLVAVTDVGIIVFEVKSYSGWLFGNGNQPQWTQVLAYGKQKYRFYNPIMQNNKHVAELRKLFMRYENLPFYSIVVFYGDCVLKEINFVPDGTLLVKSERVLDVVKIILEENTTAYYSNKLEVFRLLKEAVICGGIIENQTKHKENIKDILGKHRIFE